MDVPDGFKYDVRIRPRLLAKGLVTEAELTKHLENLTDVQPQIDLIDLAQPALTNPEDRERPAPISARVAAAPKPLIAAVERLAPLTTPKVVTPIDDEAEDDLDDDDDEDDEDDDDEDDGDEDKVVVKAEEKIAVKAEEKAPEPPAAADHATPAKDDGEEE